MYGIREIFVDLQEGIKMILQKYARESNNDVLPTHSNLVPAPDSMRIFLSVNILVNKRKIALFSFYFR